MERCPVRRVLFFIMGIFLATLAISSTAVAAQEERYIKIVLDAQGGAAGTSELYVRTGGQLPAIVPPSRRGYTFLGYWSGVSGSKIQYYDAGGKPLTSNDFSDTSALYACWKARTYGITYGNMEGAAFGALHPESHTYGLNTKVSDPVKPDYTFFGWQVNGSAIASRLLTLGANAYDDEIVLTAVWNRAALVTTKDNSTDTVTMSSGDLEKVFKQQVADPYTGVTADDLNSEEVRLTMTAADADELAQGAADIIHLAQGEVLKFYDFSVSKTVTRQGEAPVTTKLSELPNTVEVEIALGGSLQGRSSYRVYRYHGGQAEPIPPGPETDDQQQKESFELSADGTALILRTRRLSTYAVVGGERILGGNGTVEEEAGMDVQARIQEGGDGPIYKVDIKWGLMRFSYSTGRQWDPDEHRYTDVRIYDWIPAKCYTGGNNQITVYNHSNADVLVGFSVFPRMKENADTSLMNGVDMVISTENRENCQAASEVFLQKVPAEGAEAPSIDGYLRLNGSPEDPEFYKGLATDEDGYVQVADIAVTIMYLGGPRTPKIGS